MNREYIAQLNIVLEQADTSRAHRERLFLEGRLRQVKIDLEAAEKNFGEFASKNVALDVPAQGKAMVEATASLEENSSQPKRGLEALDRFTRTIMSGFDPLKRESRNSEVSFGNWGETPVRRTTPKLKTPRIPDTIYPSIRRLPLLGVAYADLPQNCEGSRDGV